VKNLCILICILALSLQSLAQKPAIDAGQTTADTFQSDYFHFSYAIPKGWVAVPDAVRIEENKNRHETVDKMSDHSDRRFSTNVVSRTVITQYDLLIAFRQAAPVTSRSANLMPRVNVRTQRRDSMMMEAEDPAKYISLSLGSRVKKLKGPEKFVIGGHKFIRTDFQSTQNVQPMGEYLSIFATVIGDYLLEFDLRATNEKELSELVDTMQTVQFSKR